MKAQKFTTEDQKDTSVPSKVIENLKKKLLVCQKLIRSSKSLLIILKNNKKTVSQKNLKTQGITFCNDDWKSKNLYFSDHVTTHLLHNFE